MSINAAALKLMRDKGLSLDDVVEIAEALEVRRDPTAADRKQRQREREKADRDMSQRDVTRDNKEKSPTPPKEKTNPPVSSNEDTPPSLKPDHVREFWNEHAERLGLPTARDLTEKRRKAAAALIRKYTIDDFTDAISAIEHSPFLRGANDRNWRADFDFFLTPSKFQKLIEGSYAQAA